LRFAAKPKVAEDFPDKKTSFDSYLQWHRKSAPKPFMNIDLRIEHWAIATISRVSLSADEQYKGGYFLPVFWFFSRDRRIWTVSASYSQSDDLPRRK
jgi:hypothetical protein